MVAAPPRLTAERAASVRGSGRPKKSLEATTPIAFSVPGPSVDEASRTHRRKQGSTNSSDSPAIVVVTRTA